jgi:hypothetical protein
MVETLHIDADRGLRPIIGRRVEKDFQHDVLKSQHHNQISRRIDRTRMVLDARVHLFFVNTASTDRIEKIPGASHFSRAVAPQKYLVAFSAHRKVACTRFFIV